MRVAVIEDLLVRNWFAIAIPDVNVHEVVGLAGAEKPTSFDASYLGLPRNLGAELITLDRELEVAAKS